MMVVWNKMVVRRVIRSGYFQFMFDNFKTCLSIEWRVMKEMEETRISGMHNKENREPIY